MLGGDARGHWAEEGGSETGKIDQSGAAKPEALEPLSCPLFPRHEKPRLVTGQPCVLKNTAKPNPCPLKYGIFLMCVTRLYQFARASLTKYWGLGGFHGNVFSPSSRGWKSKIKVSAGRCLLRPLPWACRWPSFPSVFTWPSRCCGSVSKSSLS